MNILNLIIKIVAWFSPAQQLAIQNSIAKNMTNKDFYEERNACVKSQTTNPAYQNARVTEFEEIVKSCGGTIEKRGNASNKDGIMQTCVYIKVPKGTKRFKYQVD